MANAEVGTEVRHRLALMKPGWAYVILDHALGALLCDRGWATRNNLGYYYATDAGLALADGHERKDPT